MFNGKGIIRTMGHPKIAQIIIFPDLYDQFRNDLEKPEPSCGIYTLEKASECENENSSTMISEGTA